MYILFPNAQMAMFNWFTLISKDDSRNTDRSISNITGLMVAWWCFKMHGDDVICYYQTFRNS